MPDLLERCLGSNARPLGESEALPRMSSFAARSDVAPLNTCVASAGFSRQVPHWTWAGAAKKNKIRKRPIVFRDRERPFTENLIVDETGMTDPNLLTFVMSLTQVLQSGGSYALVEKMWWNSNVEVSWNRDEVLVSFVWSPESFCNFPDFEYCFVFSQSSKKEWCHESYHVRSAAQRLTKCTVWCCKSGVWPFGNFSGPGMETISVVWQLVCSTRSRVMLSVNCLSLGPWLLLLVAQRVQLPSLWGLMFLLRHMQNTWVVGTQRDWLSTKSLFCGCWRDVFRR